MSDERAQPYEGLARWLGEDTSDDPSTPRVTAQDGERPRRRHLRVVALAAPWVITLAVLAVTAHSGGTPAGAGSDRPAGDRAAVSGGPRPDRAQPSVEVGASEPPRARHTDPDGDAAGTPDGLAAVAIGLVRDAITGRDGATTRAVDVATAERPRPLGTGHWLVRVRAVVLRGDARRWRTATHEVWAVPLGTRAGRVVGVDRPWRVAFERPRIATAGWDAAQVDRSAVAAALRRADVRPADDLDAQQHPDLAGIIRVRSATGGGARIWLGTEPDLHVLGGQADQNAPVERAT